MSSLAERMRAWVGGVIKGILELLGETMANVLGWGVIRFLDFVEPDLIAKVRPQLEAVRDTPGMPQNIKDMINEVLSGAGAWQALVLGIVAGGSIGGPLNAALEPMSRSITNTVYNWVRSARLSPGEVMTAAFRDHAFDHLIDEDLGDQGYTPERIEALTTSMRTLLSFFEIRDLYLRDNISPDDARKRLSALGYKEDDLPHLEELFSIVPPLPDMIRFADFSALDPEVIEAWREFYDAPGFIVEQFKRLGIKPEDMNRYWFSHFIQPGRYELGELHRRGIIDDDAAKLAYRTMGYSRYWQENLLELVKEVPTRVDVRRWWDMRTITEERMRQIYHALGYYGEDLEDYIRWTKVYTDFPSMMTRFSKGWISEDDVRAWLRSLDIPEDRIEVFIQEKTTPASPDRIAEERDLTKTDITMWVKEDPAGRWNQGIELLQDLGYDSNEADMILSARVELTSSPETFEDYRKITEKWRRAVGSRPREITQNLQRKAEELVKAKDRVASLSESLKAEEAQLVDEEVLPPEATARRDELRIDLHRAEAELFRIQKEYDALRAEYHQIAT